jgi:hypothetical protein
MIVEGGYCILWEEAEPGSVHARQRIIREFGPSAVLHIPNPPRKVESKMAVARRTLLRKLAIESELLEANPQSFALNQKDLIELLEDTFAGIGDMSDEEVEALYNEATGGGSDDGEEKEKPKGRGRGRAAKKEEPAEEKPKSRGRGRGRGAASKKEEEPEEAKEKPKGRGRGRSTSRGRAAKKEEEAEETEEKPKSRGRGRGGASKRSTAPKKEEKEEAGDDVPSDGASFDLGPLLERLDDIGPMAAKAKAAGEKNTKSLGDLKKDVEEIGKSITGIVAFLTWQYNESLFDDDGELIDDDIEEIDSILDADWGA